MKLSLEEIDRLLSALSRDEWYQDKELIDKLKQYRFKLTTWTMGLIVDHTYQ